MDVIAAFACPALTDRKIMINAVLPLAYRCPISGSISSAIFKPQPPLFKIK
jgi:hypothetical protein